MDKRIKQNIIEFLDRVELKGVKEAMAMVEILNELNKGDDDGRASNTGT
jgi:hypothetical protein